MPAEEPQTLEPTKGKGIRKRLGKRRFRVLIAAVILVLLGSAYLIVDNWVLRAIYYNSGTATISWATSMPDEYSEYLEAIRALKKSRGYADAEEQIRLCYYRMAEIKREQGDWTAAVLGFTMAGNYEDAGEQVLATYYQEGLSRREAGDWEGAAKAFGQAGDYRDAAAQRMAALDMMTDGPVDSTAE